MGREPIVTEGGSSSVVGREPENPHSLGQGGGRDEEVPPKSPPSPYRRLRYTLAPRRREDPGTGM
jgi:hypothetical protein